MSEIKAAIKSLKLNKFSGVGGLKQRFCKKFQEQLVTNYKQFLCPAVERKKIPSSWAEARKIVLPKHERPISLQNVGYKHLATILAKGMNAILSSYIHQDQTGFLENRYLRDNIRQV